VQGVEVAVREQIAHLGDLTPWDAGLGREQIAVDGLSRLTDLDQTHPDGIENKSVSHIPARQVPRDHVTRLDNVFEPLTIILAHNG
jgi:hypothetical protein